MTETAAIALMILDQRPDLAPAPGTSQRPQFQRLLVWLVANVYPTFTYADYPERWAPAAAEQLVENCRQYRKISISGSNSSWPPGRGAGRDDNVAGLLYRGDVPLGTPPRGLTTTRQNSPPSPGRSVSDRSWPRRYAVTS